LGVRVSGLVLQTLRYRYERAAACAESWAYIGPQKVVPVIIEGCANWNTAATTPRASPPWTPQANWKFAALPANCETWKKVIQKSPINGSGSAGGTASGAPTASGTLAGPRTDVPRKKTLHPHRDCSGQVVVVHNGIIENYLELKEQLQREGHKFITETDTEIVAHLVEKNLQGSGGSGKIPLEEAVRKSLKQLRGIYALVFLSTSDPDKIVAARLGPPAVVGLAEGEYLWPATFPRCSSTPATYFSSPMAISPCSLKTVSASWTTTASRSKRKPHHVAWDPIMAEKGGYKHYMQKEIFRNSARVRDTFFGTHFAGQRKKSISAKWASPSSNFAISQMCASSRAAPSWHAALAGKFMIERLARLPVEVDYGSEFRYRDPILDAKTLTVVHQPVGRNGDTIAAQREAKQKRSPTLGDLQCSWLDDYPRSCWNDFDARRAGNWRCFTKAFTGAAHRTGLACRVSWGSSRSVIRQRGKKSFAGIYHHPAQD